MAAQTDSELESTLAGDQGTSLSLSTAADTTSSSRLNATRQELEKWQLQHTIQLLKLELSQKNIIMETVKSDHAHQLEELRETLSEVQCERKLLQQRLKALTHVYEVSTSTTITCILIMSTYTYRPLVNSVCTYSSICKFAIITFIFICNPYYKYIDIPLLQIHRHTLITNSWTYPYYKYICIYPYTNS